MLKNILVIEDSKIINNVIKKELTSHKLKVTQAFTLAEAQAILQENKFHLIILDLHLPDGEGSELIAHIQSLTKTKVVVLTSFQNDDLREELFQYGILDYIIKDKNLLYSINEIIKIIENISAHKKDRILVIDDSKFICKQIKIILEPRNYQVISAYSGKMAMSRLEKNNYKLIILDMELPDIHGMQLLEIIRKNSDFLDIPIIVLSGTATPEIIRNVLKNGANDYLKKPFVFEEFILKIDLWIDYFEKEKALKEKTTQLQHLNKNLEQLVQKEVEKNRKKDKLLFMQSRHAQMGEMISMIAHQWRQPLNAINAAIGVIDFKIKRDKLEKDTAMQIIKKIYNYVEYLSNTIDDFREFFKPQKEKQSTTFEIIYTKALSLIKPSLLKHDINIHLHVKDIIQFKSYENELVQVVLNLLKNAEDALVENEIKNPEIIVEINTTSLTIRDNAKGIPEKIMEKIFDPYFSTKKEKQGTGIGLYMSKIIVEEHCNGKLEVHNEKEGACFTLSLPISKEESELSCYGV